MIMLIYISLKRFAHIDNIIHRIIVIRFAINYFNHINTNGLITITFSSHARMPPPPVRSLETRNTYISQFHK